MAEIERLNRDAVGLVPAIDGHLVRDAGQPGGNHHVFLVAGHQDAQRVRRSQRHPLVPDRLIVLRKDGHRGHRRAGRNWGGRQFHFGGGVNGIHHLARRQQAVQLVGNALRGIRGDGGEKIIFIRANGQIVRRRKERGHIGGTAGHIRHGDRAELAKKSGDVARQKFSGNGLVARRQIQRRDLAGKGDSCWRIGVPRRKWQFLRRSDGGKEDQGA
jgi:hypothetical protein